MRLLRWMLKVLPSSSRGQAIFTLTSGTLLAQSVAFLARPVLTRLYTPEAFGILGFIFALVSVLSVASSGRYEDAIMLPSRTSRSLQVLFLSMGLSLLVALMLLCLLPIRGWLAHLLHKPALATHMLWFPPALLFISWNRQLETWLTRQRLYPRVAIGQITRQSITVPAQVATGLYGGEASALIGSAVAGYMAQCAVLIRHLLRTPFLRTLRHTPWRMYLRIAYRYRDFPRFTLWANLLNTLSGQLPLFALMYFFTSATVGHYALAYSTLTLPITLLGTAIARVFFVDIAEARRRGQTATLTYVTYQNLLLIGGFPILSLTVVAPALFRLVFGNAWALSGAFAAWMAPWILVLFITSPLTFLIDVLEKQKIAFYMTSSLLVARAVVLVIGGIFGSALETIALYSLTSFTFLSVYLVILTGLGGVSSRQRIQGLRTSLRYFLLPGCLLLPVYLLPSLLWQVGSWLLALGVYGLLVYRKVQWQLPTGRTT